MSNAVSLKDVCTTFGDKVVLDKFCLDIERGESIVIIGKSGVGKSVLLKHILGSIKPQSGTITIHSHKATSSLPTLGMLFQNSALFDSLTIRDNVAFYMENNDGPWAQSEIEDKVVSALELVGLEDTINLYPSSLSGGMQKRAALARVIAYSPAMILYDEPTTGLDASTAMQINQLILKTQKKLQATSIIVTHDVISALYTADRLVLIEDGKAKYINVPELFIHAKHPTIQAFVKTIGRSIQEIREMRYEHS